MKATAVVVLASCFLTCWTVQGVEQQSAAQAASPAFGQPRQPVLGAQPFGQQPGLRQPGFGRQPSFGQQFGFGQQPRFVQPGRGAQAFGQQPGFIRPGFGLQPAIGRQPALGGVQPSVGRQPLLGGIQPGIGFQAGSYGTISFPTVEFPINSYDYAMCTLDPKGSRFNVRGLVQFRQLRTPYGMVARQPLEMVINITGLTPNQNHGFQVRTWGDHSNGCSSTADIYNPLGVQHGGPNNVPYANPNFKTRMVGDFGNVQADQFGQVNTKKIDPVARIAGDSIASILGRSVAVYERLDDLGTTGTTASLINGNVGDPMACCIIGKADATSWPGNREKIIQMQQQQPQLVNPYFAQFGQYGFGQPFWFPGQPLTNTMNPAQPYQPTTQPNQPASRLNPANPTAPFNPLPGQFAFNTPGAANPFGGPVPGANPFPQPGFTPMNPNPAGTAPVNPQLGAGQQEKSAK